VRERERERDREQEREVLYELCERFGGRQEGRGGSKETGGKSRRDRRRDGRYMRTRESANVKCNRRSEMTREGAAIEGGTGWIHAMCGLWPLVESETAEKASGDRANYIYVHIFR
jgi:hypothetical protein